MSGPIFDVQSPTWASQTPSGLSPTQTGLELIPVGGVDCRRSDGFYVDADGRTVVRQMLQNVTAIAGGVTLIDFRLLLTASFARLPRLLRTRLALYQLRSFSWLNRNNSFNYVN